MKHLKSIKGTLITVLLICLCLKVIAWVLLPIRDEAERRRRDTSG
ncbi:hypothetical protein EV643_1354 [Kribbella sp. VKM Ac-2527]|uniref:Uncharacterized protein n=1 Tax=Kribbella caucasensis TaxID=2512215 RepID=A0A4R6J5I8_9ACTN|nr:hypothetical protein [Kribbella sp. VKM Ac-2527]TDO30682.1 hypothetical protein EV643_1354 [Kribbella sp. VKM Ac-2527]